jgi:hypothetical protein
MYRNISRVPVTRGSLLPGHCSAFIVLTLKWLHDCKRAQCCLWFHESKSVTTVQRRLRTSGGDLPDNSITRWYDDLPNKGCISKC